MKNSEYRTLNTEYSTCGSPQVIGKTFTGRIIAAFLVANVIMASLGNADTTPDAAGMSRYLFCGDAFAAATRTAAIAVDPISGAVTLSATEYIIPGSGNKLYGTTAKTGFGRKLDFGVMLIGKMIFHLDDPRTVNGATVALFGRNGEAAFNGAPLLFDTKPNQAGWMFADVPRDLLRRGENIIIFTKGFGLAQDREKDPPRHSWLSHDHGQTWQKAAGGEFLVNLILRRHPAEGVITSPVIDLANPHGTVQISALPVGSIVTGLDCGAVIPTDTAVRLESRRGETPWPDATWGKWRTGKISCKERYLQWRVILATSDPRATPAVSNVTLNISHREKPLTDNECALLALKHDVIKTTSYEYGYQRPSPKLRKLREDYKLDEIVAEGQTDLDKLLLLRNWVRRQWPGNDGFGGRWDALEILDAPPGGKGMCVQFGNLFAQCALALGYVARPVIINHHFIGEAWLDDLGKWVAFDVEGCYPPLIFKCYATAHYVAAGTRQPLSAREVCDAWWRTVTRNQPMIDEIIQVFAYDEGEATAVPHDVVRPPAELDAYAVIGLPLRNNHLDVAEPWEEYHGQDYYHSNDYLWWNGAVGQARPEQYPLATGRVSDFEWSVNQVEIALSATANPHKLQVTLKTMTPNFAFFSYRFNDDAWQKLSGQSRDADRQWAILTWPLRKGHNTLEVKAVNNFQRNGAASRAAVNLK